MNYQSNESNSYRKTAEEIWILRETNSSNDSDFPKKSSSLNRKTNKCVHYAPFLIEEINKTNKKPKSGQDLNNLQSILRIGSSNCVNSNDLGSECIWIKQDSSTYTNSLLFDKEIDNFLSKKYFYLDEVYSNLVDLKKNENYLEMKKSKQQQTSGLISQDKQIVRSSSLAAAKNKLNKKVDFLDLKLNNCLNKSKKSENNSLPSSSQSSPKSTLSNQHSNEDSFVDSNFSSSSSEMIQPSKSSKKLSSLSSTSSGVGSSNVSSASSTTSESSSADFASSKSKKAPKAIISDDGDIEIENPNNCSKIPKPVEPPSRSSMRIIDQSVYKNEAKKYNNIYYVNAKNSMCLNNRCSQPSTPLQSAYHHQTFYQNQLAAAAAAAAAKDKEKQRDALMEYFKNQQLQEHLQKYSKNEMPNESLRSLSKQIGLEISCKMKNERCGSNAKIYQPSNCGINYHAAVLKAPARRDSCLGLCYLIYGPETKRTLLPSQVTGIDTVKALFVRAFAEKLTMGYLDDEKCVKIYIKDQIKDLFYQLDDMNDIKDKCVLKLVDISNAQPSNKMTQSQYCYSNLSEHQSATIDEKSSEKVPACLRSLSEPRIQIKKAAAPKPTYQNPIYNHPCQEYILTNQDLMNQTLNSNVETYDNLDGQSAHQSRIESKYVLPAPLSYHDRYNRSLNPIYNSMRIESRDAKSVDRDAVYKNGASAALKSEPPTPQLSRQSTINEHSFAQSVAAPKTKIGGADIDATEDDTISLPSSISARGFKNFHADFSKNLDSTEYDVECDDDEKTVNEENVESCENSKLKMKLMQKQLETLTNLVHQALINKDLNRLEGIAHTAKFNQSRLMPMDVNRSSIGLLNDQAKQLKNDLNAIKKMHANFNFVVGESFREFVDQINDKLRGLCANEKNQNSRIDCLVNRYNSDFSKIENELCDLETVVDDLRERILKQKYKINIDDVECYALALSQLSKQLVNLKTSFSSIKEHHKQNSPNNPSRFVNVESIKLDMIIKRCKRITGILIIMKKLAILPRNPFLKKAHNPPGLPPLVKQISTSQDNMSHVSKNFSDDIQMTKSDHEPQKLAIEVDAAFNQLMSEISMIAHDINPNKTFKNCLTIESYKIENDSLDSDSLMSNHDAKLDLEVTMNKRSKFRAQKNQFKNDRENSANSSSSTSSSFGSTPSSPTYFSNNSSPLPLVSSHLNGINIQTMPIPLPVPLCTQYMQNKSYLETVQEEEPPATLDAETNRSHMEMEMPNMSEEEMLDSVENQLYEQLSQFKPVKKSFKTSASICLANHESNEQSENSNVSTSMVITPHNQLNEGLSDVQCSIGNGKNSKLGVRFSDPGLMKAVKSKIITNGSMQRVSMNKNENNDLDKNNFNSVNVCFSENGRKKENQMLNADLANKTSILSTVLVQKRNSESSKNGICSNVMGSSTSSIASCSSTPRRVSLSVTDL